MNDITVHLSPYRYSNNVRILTKPKVTDNSGRVRLISSTKSPDNTYPVGTTTIEYIYGDYFGNNDSVSFNVSVIGSGLYIVFITLFEVCENNLWYIENKP